MQELVTSRRWDAKIIPLLYSKTRGNKPLKIWSTICIVTLVVHNILSPQLSSSISPLQTHLEKNEYLFVEDPFPCVYSKWPGGWGNTVLLLLYNVIRNTRLQDDGTPVFPCVTGYGEVFSSLFANLERCPPTIDVKTQCYGTSKNPKEHLPFADIRSFIYKTIEPWQQQLNNNTSPNTEKLARRLLQLNSTYINEVVLKESGASFRLDTLLQPNHCAVHIRMGDLYFRSPTRRNPQEKLDKENRACNKYSTIKDCFKGVTRQIQETICNFKTDKVYVATDVGNYTRYLCHKHRKRDSLWLSSCQEKDIEARSRHTNDLKLMIAKKRKLNPNATHAFYGMLTDWVSLIFANTSSSIGHSSFSETARINFEAV